MSGTDTITPEYQPHRNLESRAQHYLESLGFYVSELTYHSSLPKVVARTLSRRYTPTALYLRGRADRIAVHKLWPLEFEWEAKTHKSRKYHDLTLETLPLLHHLTKASLGVKCLYICHNPHSDLEVGFWIHQMPTIRECWIPTNRWQGHKLAWFKSIFSMHLSGVKIVEQPINGGSGDPFVIIDQGIVRQLSDWKTLIGTEISSVKKAIQLNG